MGCIYALLDPRDHKVRYIGKTTGNAKRRLAGHQTPSELSTPTHKNNWIRKLQSCGLRPLVEVIDTVSDEQLNHAETVYIRYFRCAGFDLTNATDGGDGQSPGYVPSAETLAKVSKALKGRRQTPEHIAARSNAMRGRHVSSVCREKIARTLRGRQLGPFSEEHRNKIAKAHGARPFCDQFGNVYGSVRAAARAIGAKHPNVVNVLKKDRGSVLGYEFRYLEPQSS